MKGKKTKKTIRAIRFTEERGIKGPTTGGKTGPTDDKPKSKQIKDVNIPRIVKKKDNQQ